MLYKLKNRLPKKTDLSRDIFRPGAKTYLTENNLTFMGKPATCEKRGSAPVREQDPLLYARLSPLPRPR